MVFLFVKVGGRHPAAYQPIKDSTTHATLWMHSHLASSYVCDL